MLFTSVTLFSRLAAIDPRWMGAFRTLWGPFLFSEFPSGFTNSNNLLQISLNKLFSKELIITVILFRPYIIFGFIAGYLLQNLPDGLVDFLTVLEVFGPILQNICTKAFQKRVFIFFLRID